jgi:hypothetical protein
MIQTVKLLLGLAQHSKSSIRGPSGLMTLYLLFSKTVLTASVVLWSEFLATDPEARVRFPALPEKNVVGLERGALSP